MIVSCLGIGITKRALLFDYYLDEIGEIIHEYNVMHRRADDSTDDEADVEYVDTIF